MSVNNEIKERIQRMIIQNVIPNNESLKLNPYRVPREEFQSWQYSLSGSTDPEMLSQTDKHRLALAGMMYSLENEGRTLFHMTTTYKPIKDRSEASVKEVNVAYKAFYMRRFLPHLMGTDKYHKDKFKAIQPICFSFVDDGKHRAVLNSKGESVFPARLHHHSIVAIHPDTLDTMKQLEGVDTLFENNLITPDYSKSWLIKNKFDDVDINKIFLYKHQIKDPDFNKSWFLTKRIMTSDIKECEAERLFYASKMMKKFPEFMSFPDTFKRRRN